jgi:tRNA(adenine34) deaminase
VDPFRQPEQNLSGQRKTGENSLNENITDADLKYLSGAVQAALDADRRGNLPVGAVIVLDDKIIAEAGSRILAPFYHPGRHAEIEALRKAPARLWPRDGEMTCYTTLEPCVMCFGALLLHSVGRIVFGAEDKKGGAKTVLNHLPEFYADRSRVPLWLGPALPEVCDELYLRAQKRFEGLP